MTEPDLNLLMTLVQKSLDELKVIRAESGELRRLVLALAEQGRRIERRVEELRDDLELMLKAELMGRLGNFEMAIDTRIGSMEARIEHLAAELGPRQ